MQSIKDEIAVLSWLLEPEWTAKLGQGPLEVQNGWFWVPKKAVFLLGFPSWISGSLALALPASQAKSVRREDVMVVVFDRLLYIFTSTF